MQEEFIKIVSRQLGRGITSTELHVSVANLGLDSLEFMELVMAIETGLVCSVDTDNIPIECTLQDLLDRVSV